MNPVMNLQDGEFLAQLRTTEEGVCSIVLVGWLVGWLIGWLVDWFVLTVHWKEGVGNKVIM